MIWSLGFCRRLLGASCSSELMTPEEARQDYHTFAHDVAYGELPPIDSDNGHVRCSALGGNDAEWYVADPKKILGNFLTQRAVREID